MAEVYRVFLNANHELTALTVVPVYDHSVRTRGSLLRILCAIFFNFYGRAAGKFCFYSMVGKLPELLFWNFDNKIRF